MNKKEVILLSDRVETEFLPFVRRPSRYIGGEVNQIRKDLHTCELRVALCFPDIYEIAASYNGLAIIYDILNKIDTIAAERVFSPWHDAEEILRQKHIPLFTLESRAAVKSFDAIGFSLTNELCYTNVLNILDLAGINIRSQQRTEDDPLIIAGGAMSNCCEPIADFIDLFVLGEAEDAIVELMQLIRSEKKAHSTKQQILLKAAEKFSWVYVPSLYEFEYDSDMKIKSFKPASNQLPTEFTNAVVKDFDSAAVPLEPIIPFAKAVHERVSIEIMRGCPGRCLFCQASFCRRPIRFRSVDKILEIAKTACRNTGFETISLLSLSTADYPQLEELVTRLQQYFNDRHVGISLPSLRVDKQLKLTVGMVAAVRKSGLTIAVESANEKIRQIINKPLKDCDLFAAVESAYKAGWQKLKLYFMTGLPGETPEDIKQIVNLSYQLARLRRQIDGKTAQINVAISCFVPKPHTPLAWLQQKSKDYFENAEDIILDEKRKLGAKFLYIKFHDPGRSVLESVIARGDRRLSAVIETAWQNGAKFDLWDECFDYQIWQHAFEQHGLNLENTAQQHFDTDQILPWQHLIGPKKQYLLDHLQKAKDLLTEISN